MDRKGFDLIDREYQANVNAAKEQITSKWEGFYSGKKYVGTPEMQAQARANDNAQKMKQINADLGAVQQKFGSAHYGEKGRDATLKEIERQEELKRRTEKIRQDFQQRSNDNQRKR